MDPQPVGVDGDGDGDELSPAEFGQHRDGASEQLHPVLVSVLNQHTKAPENVEDRSTFHGRAARDCVVARCIGF